MYLAHHLVLVFLVLYKFTNGGEYIKYGDQTYYISYPQEYNWYESYRYCAAHGMYLIDIRTEMEYNRFLDMTKTYYKKHNMTGAKYWTSGMRLGQTGTFYWLTTGQSLEYRNWLGGHPKINKSVTGDTAQICLAISGFDDNKHKFFDTRCSNSRSFICRDTLDVATYKSNGCLSQLDILA